MENPFELILEKLNTLESLIRNQKNNGIPSDTNPKPDIEILTIIQASEFLHLAKSTIYKMTSVRTITHFKMGKRIYFKRKDLEDWIGKHKVKTYEEIQQEADLYLSTRGNKRNV